MLKIDVTEMAKAVDTTNITSDTREDIANLNELEIEDIEWSADQEILLLYSLYGYKPVGPNKHFRMLLIQDRLSNALNKNISSRAIWRKLNTLYDLEALDEAEAEADAAVAVETAFFLPEDEFGELMANKLKEPLARLDRQRDENDQEGLNIDIKYEVESEADVINSTDASNIGVNIKENIRKENSKRGLNKKVNNSIREVGLKKDLVKEVNKKDTPTKKEVLKDIKKGALKEDDRKDIGKKTVLEVRKDISKDSKKETPNKVSKRESLKFMEIKKEDVKKNDQKKVADMKTIRGDSTKIKVETKQLRNDLQKRNEIKSGKVESYNSQKLDLSPTTQKNESLKKDICGDKKKDFSDKKNESKSPEKTPENLRGTKLRAREKKEAEADKLETLPGIKRERSRDSTSKADIQNDEPVAKKLKTIVFKGRLTRNSLEPVQKSTSPVTSQKRRTRL